MGVAAESYVEFARLKRAGTIPAGCRFMVAIPISGVFTIRIDRHSVAEEMAWRVDVRAEVGHQREHRVHVPGGGGAIHHAGTFRAQVARAGLR